MELNKHLTCPVCLGHVTVNVTRKGNGLSFKCDLNARHYRGFMMDQDFLARVLRNAKRAS